MRAYVARSAFLSAVMGCAYLSGCGSADAPVPVATGSDAEATPVDSAATRLPGAASERESATTERDPQSNTPLVDLLTDRSQFDTTPPARTQPTAAGNPSTDAPAAGSPETFEPPAGLDLAAHGIRRLLGAHVTLYTDLPESEAVNELPRLFDQAVPQWASYFRVPDVRTQKWHVSAYVMDSEERFRGAGLIPRDLPDFPHGYQMGNALWMFTQPSDYYLRHMFLHEGTHAFMNNLMGGAGPDWYMEGVAELLATHRWEEKQLTMGWMPTSREAVPYWGRIKIIQDEFAAGQGLMLQEVMRLKHEEFRNVRAYAWAWAAVAFLDGHPGYQSRFRALRGDVRDSTNRFTLRFESELQHQLRQLDEEWQLFVMHAEYGYDFSRAAVKYKAGVPVPSQAVNVEIAADRGWQSTGYRLNAGQTYEVTAAGQFVLGQQPQAWRSEPDGVTLHYYQGQPVGRLLGNVRLDEAKPGIANLGRPVPLGKRRTVQPSESGTLYLRINESPADLADNQGSITVTLRRIEP